MVVLVDFYNVLYNPQKGELDKDVISLLVELREKGIPIYLFTNILTKRLKLFEDQFHFEQYFDGVISGDMYLKPEPEAFEKLEEITGSNFEDMIFIDDSTKNIEVGKSFGIKGIVFVGAEDLRGEIKGLLNLI